MATARVTAHTHIHSCTRTHTRTLLSTQTHDLRMWIEVIITKLKLHNMIYSLVDEALFMTVICRDDISIQCVYQRKCRHAICCSRVIGFVAQWRCWNMRQKQDIIVTAQASWRRPRWSRSDRGTRRGKSSIRTIYRALI